MKEYLTIVQFETLQRLAKGPVSCLTRHYQGPEGQALADLSALSFADIRYSSIGELNEKRH